jgi:hypothetical protein
VAKFKLNKVRTSSKIKMLKYLKLLIKDLKTLGVLRNSKLEMVKTTPCYIAGKKKYKKEDWENASYIVEIYTKRSRYTIVPYAYAKPLTCYVEKFYKNHYGNCREINLQKLIPKMKKTRKIELTVL